VEARLKFSRALPWLGVVAGGLLLVNVNVLGARWYKRWDFTSDKLYSLSQPTRELLTGLKQPVEVSVLLSKGDPLLVSVRHMLEAYGAVTPGGIFGAAAEVPDLGRQGRRRPHHHRRGDRAS
jgi:hypothetical protein